MFVIIKGEDIAKIQNNPNPTCELLVLSLASIEDLCFYKNEHYMQIAHQGGARALTIYFKSFDIYEKYQKQIITRVTNDL